MTEKDLIHLGFTRNDVTSEECECDNDWYYYTYQFKSDICLISCDSEEAEKEDGFWFVEIFDVDGVRFTNIDNVGNLICLVENATVK